MFTLNSITATVYFTRPDLRPPPPTTIHINQKEVLDFFFFGYSVYTLPLTRPADRPCLHHAGVCKDIFELVGRGAYLKAVSKALHGRSAERASGGVNAVAVEGEIKNFFIRGAPMEREG